MPGGSCGVAGGDREQSPTAAAAAKHTHGSQEKSDIFSSAHLVPCSHPEGHTTYLGHLSEAPHHPQCLPGFLGLFPKSVLMLNFY